MPKEERHLAPLRDLQLVKRARTQDVVPFNVYWQVLGAGTAGGARSLFLYTEHGRYLFNCSEGTQRLALEHCKPHALSQLGQIFITHRSWRNLGGLPGMCLSIRAAGAPDVTVHGPRGCMDLYEATKSFILLFEFDIRAHTAEQKPFSDGAVTVQHFTMDYSGPAIHPTAPKYSDWNPDSAPSLDARGEKINGETWQDRVLARERRENPIEETATAYGVTVKGRPGKLQMRKCMEAGVPPGPLLGVLKAGHDVTLEDGSVVRAADVMGDAAQPSTYVVIEIPNEHYLPGLTGNSELAAFIEQARDSLKIVFHFSPSSVVRSAAYKAWMESMPLTIRHVVLNDESLGYGSGDVLSFAHKLHLINPELFPGMDAAGDPRLERMKGEASYSGYACSVAQAQTGVKYECRPLDAVDVSAVVACPHDAARKEVMDIRGIEGYLNFAQRDPNEARHIAETVVDGLLESVIRPEGSRPPLQQQATMRPTPPETCSAAADTAPSFPRITFLGTGSSVPGKYRCVSAILAELSADTFAMLDCGEGALLQLHRRFGRAGALQVLRGLKAIYVSHLHADHHLGLINLVQERARAFRSSGQPVPRLIILATGKIARFLSFYHDRFESILEDLFLVRLEHLLYSSPANRDSLLRTQMLYPDQLRDVLDSLGLRSIVTSRAFHCPSAFSVSLVTDADFKLIYTGDTRPCKDLVDLGLLDNQAPDLVIHEATMEHYMLADCQAKRHSTFSEAVRSGRDMRAKFTLLTHFSQRYAKLPLFHELEESVGSARPTPLPDVGVAFDHMTVTPRTFAAIPRMYPALKEIFAEDVATMQARKDNFEYKLCSAVIAKELDIGESVSARPPKEQAKTVKLRVPSADEKTDLKPSAPHSAVKPASERQARKSKSPSDARDEPASVDAAAAAAAAGEESSEWPTREKKKRKKALALENLINQVSGGQ